MIKRVKAGNFWFVAVKNLDGIRIDVVRTLSIPPHYNVSPEDFNFRAVTKHVDRCFVLEKAAIASWRIFYVHFIEREIGGNDVMYEFKLKASQFIFNGDFERKFVDSLYIRHLFFKIDFEDERRAGPFCKH